MLTLNSHQSSYPQRLIYYIKIHMNTDNQLQAYLLDFGLNKNEVKVYLFLLKTGPSTVLSISKHIRVNRTTVHLAIDSLDKKGLISTIRKSNKRFVIAEEPRKLKYLLSEQELEFKRKKVQADSFINLIENTINNLKENTFSELRSFEGIQNCRRMYDFVLTSNEINSYVNSTFTADLFPENVEKFELRLQEGLILNDIIINGKVMNDFVKTMSKYPNYKSKFLRCEHNFNALDYMITDKGIAILYIQGNPNGIVIYNKAIVDTAYSLFKTIWSII
jgi:sugar-specific transcriptional regulator TrmB